MADLTKLTISEARNGLKNKEFTTVELTEAYLKKMDECRKLNAFVCEAPEKALEQARADGPLHGGFRITADAVFIGKILQSAGGFRASRIAVQHRRQLFTGYRSGQIGTVRDTGFHRPAHAKIKPACAADIRTGIFVIKVSVFIFYCMYIFFRSVSRRGG